MAIEIHRIAATNCPHCGAPLSQPGRCDRCAATFFVPQEDPEALAREQLAGTQRFYVRAMVALGLALAIPVLYLQPWLSNPMLLALAYGVFPALVASVCAALATDFLPLAAQKAGREALVEAFMTWANKRRIWWYLPKLLAAFNFLWAVGVRNPHAYAATGFMLGFGIAALAIYFGGIA